MSKTVFIKNYTLPEIDKDEVLRYMGVRVSDESTDSLVDFCISECEKENCFVGKVCFAFFDAKITQQIIDTGVATIKSDSLSKHIEGCEKIIIFAATVGVGIDRLIEKYSRLSPSKALCLSSIGAQRIESLCDAFCDDIKAEYSEFSHKSRFSPGYGDFDISNQGDIFGLLNCSKNIGLSLCDSFIMSPSKSVTAIIGLKAKE